MSTIPPRGQAPDNKGLYRFPSLKYPASQRTLQTQDVGTDAQIPAQSHLPIPETVNDPAFQDHFWSVVNKTQGCWTFKYLGRDGYGRIRTPGSRAQYRAHRLSYFIAYGVDPADLLVCHKCDNPSCVRPDHLFLGTNDDNMADMRAKGRHVSVPQGGSANGNSTLTEDDVRQVVRLILSGRNNKDIAKLFDVSHSIVSRIRVGRSWGDFTASIGYTPKASKMSPKSGRTKCNLNKCPPPTS